MTAGASQLPGKRAQVVFKALVERYIRDGQPVGSKTLATDAGLPVSPATVRHILADLEAQGFLRSPHTSAGRVPTARGYRLFVDSLLTIQPLAQTELNAVKRKLTSASQTPALLETASDLLANITSLTAIVTIPKRKSLYLTHIEFLPLSGDRVLAVLVFNENEVQNRILHTGRVFSASELQQASNYVNIHFCGKEFSRLKHFLKKKMREDKHAIDQLLAAAIHMQPQSPEDFVMSGQVRLLDFVDNADMVRLRELFDAFSQKRDIMYLLEQCLQTGGIQLFIGEESGYEPLDNCTVVSSPYTLNGQVIGALAVIGPTRMAYDRVIPVVDITAKLLSAALDTRA